MSWILCNHATFYLSYLGMNYSNGIGFLTFIVFLLQFLSGPLLSRYHSPFIASSPVYYIMIDVNVGRFIRFFHVLGAPLFMVFILFHRIRGTWIGLKMIEQIEFWHSIDIGFLFRLNLIWVPGWVILPCPSIEGSLGYIPNRGQMSYWGITAMINIPPIIPLFGSFIGEYPRCSSLVIVNRIFVFHYPLGWLIGCIILVHIAPLHTFPSPNPSTNNNSIIIPSYALFFKDCFVSYVTPLFPCFYPFWEPDRFGNCDNPIIANPPPTPNHTLPEWYSLTYHCCLSAFPNKTMGVIIIVVLFLLFFLCTFQPLLDALFDIVLSILVIMGHSE